MSLEAAAPQKDEQESLHGLDFVFFLLVKRVTGNFSISYGKGCFIAFCHSCPEASSG